MQHPLPSAISLISARIVVIMVSFHPYGKRASAGVFAVCSKNHHDLFFANGLRVLQDPFVIIPPNHPTEPTEATSAKYFPRRKDSSGRV
jgi:hypothetical protein